MENNNINLKEEIKGENNMRISTLKSGRICKFIAGVLEKVRDNKINGEFEIYSINKEIVNKVAELREKIKDETELFYNIIPIISNVEMDVSLQEFKDMMDCPSNQFIEFINQIISVVGEMFGTSKTIANLNNTVKNLKSELPKPEELNKTKEELLNNLYSQLSTPEIKSDKDKRMAILDKINKLESNEKSA